MIIYAPVFALKDGNEVVFPFKDWYSEKSEDEAENIALGLSFVEAILYGFKWTKKILTIDESKPFPHVKVDMTFKGDIGEDTREVYVVGGLLFDEKIKEYEEKKNE